MYSSYCDCGKFIQPVDYPFPMPIPEESETAAPEEVSESSVKKGKMKAEPVAPAPVAKPQQFAYFISRGVELLDSEERMIGMWDHLSLFGFFIRGIGSLLLTPIFLNCL